MKHFLLLFLLSCSVYSQTDYPQDYFRNPLDISLVLSGTFAELRSSHFHGGLDIKTQQREGLKVYAAAEGYISRIKISHYGYGKAIYITHPNGYTTVYGHLQKFSKRLEEYIKYCQYDRESFEVEVFPHNEELLIAPNEVIAYSGNTGGSGGPHLHFEIRDNQERPMNPLLFGLEVQDTTAPYVSGVFAYPKNKDATINGKNKRLQLRLIPQKSGDYEVEQITAHGEIGFGVVSNDKQDLAPNNNGVSNIQTFFNGNKSLEVDFKRFSFSETKHIKRYVDYEHYKTQKAKIQKLFIEKNNPLSLFKDANNKGYVRVEDSTASVYKIRISDYHQNETWVTIPINGKSETILNEQVEDLSNKTRLYADKATTLTSGYTTVNFYKNTLYEDAFIDYRVSADTIFLHEDNIPLQKNFYINYDLSHYKDEDQSKLFVARFYGDYKKPYYVSSSRKGNVLTGTSRALGRFALAVDTIPPKITPVNFQNKKWMSKYRYLKVKIEDDLSGISKYRATVNGKWILMEYDYKTNMLVHDFNDNIVKDTKNELKIIVTDNVGNSSTFEATFFRK
ncbi:peptidase M23-like protein [Winogradskyella epiphytica]|uniref:Peptidase M23-like protein n=1 Tax=Winogradskyella epiphytica TaxID=262005 RepID=A0A2V4XGA7_9FLAO|nr:M23 family metallopeptidase [Winogradskyella epiphytica]PYE81894.1 peptidase M23-like protein [Winogradskyella epiphytica]GGW61948.1 peptidase M23 [Winogradskyella epiphytica]